MLNTTQVHVIEKLHRGRRIEGIRSQKKKLIQKWLKNVCRRNNYHGWISDNFSSAQSPRGSCSLQSESQVTVFVLNIFITKLHKLFPSKMFSFQTALTDVLTLYGITLRKASQAFSCKWRGLNTFDLLLLSV